MFTGSIHKVLEQQYLKGHLGLLFLPGGSCQLCTDECARVQLQSAFFWGSQHLSFCHPVKSCSALPQATSLCNLRHLYSLRHSPKQQTQFRGAITSGTRDYIMSCMRSARFHPANTADIAVNPCCWWGKAHPRCASLDLQLWKLGSCSPFLCVTSGPSLPHPSMQEE